MKPRADFVCLGKRCRTEDGAQTYELPVDAIACPSCGSRRLQRLYNQVNVASGMARRTDAVVGPAWEAAAAPGSAARDAVARGSVGNGCFVPMSQVGDLMGKLGLSRIPLPQGKAETVARPFNPVAAGFTGKPPRPDPVNSLRDREFSIKVTKDAQGNFKDAEAVRAT